MLRRRSIAIATAGALLLPLVAIGQADAVVTCVTESPTLITLTDSGAMPTATGSSLSPSVLVVSTRSQVVTAGITITDDCLGADSVVANLTSSTGKSRSISLSFVDWQQFPEAGTSDSAIELWKGTSRFGNVDKGTWYLQSATVTGVFGEVVVDGQTGETVSESLTFSDPQLQPVPWRKLSIFAVTTSAVNATPEPIVRTRTLTVYAAGTRAEGTAFVANKYAPVTIQYRMPGTSTWKTLKSTTFDRFGKASATLRPWIKGTWGFRTVTPGRTGYTASTSSVDWVSVV